jgi:hypothetical protein
MSRRIHKLDLGKKLEVEPGAWERFRRAIHVAVKAGPQHRKAKTKTKTKRMTAVVAALALVGAPLSAHCATWLRCVPATEFKVGDSDASRTIRPMDGNALVYTFVVIGEALAVYNVAAQAIYPVYGAVVEPSAIVVSREWSGSVVLGRYIDRQTGAYEFEVHEPGDPTYVWSIVKGTCTAIRPQPIAPNKF